MLSFSKFLIPAAVGASLLLAACGGSSNKSGSSTPSGSASPSASQPVSSSGAGVTIGTASGSAGTYLTGASGRALYIWVADSTGKSSCSGACAKAWPPVTASSMPHVSGGANASDLSLISRPDGTQQVTYKGRPLYYYVGDTGAGSTNGQGSNQFGAKWWLLSPAGGPVSRSSASASSGASSTGSASGSSSGGSASGWG